MFLGKNPFTVAVAVVDTAADITAADPPTGIPGRVSYTLL